MMRFLRSDQPFGSTLLVLMLDRFVDPEHDDPKKGPACLGWAPETIQKEFYAELGTELPADNLDRLMAAIAIVTTDAFKTSAGRFVRLADALCGNGLQLDVDLPDVTECSWAILEAGLLDPADEGNHKGYHDSIRVYLKNLLRREGWLRPPPILSTIVGDMPSTGAGEGGWARQADLEAELKEAMDDGLDDLAAQLDALPLRQGNADEFVKRVRDQLRRSRMPSGDK